MLAKRIIPCLDVDNGRVKKGVNFRNLVDVGDPVAIAAEYERQGADELVFLDITATNSGRQTMADVVEGVSQKVFMPLTVGGGIKSVAEMARLLRAGADKVSINTAAVLNPTLITAGANQFGSQAIVCAIDAAYDSSTDSYRVYTNGGQQKTELDAVDWAAKAVKLGAGELLVTSMDKDGTKSGFDLRLYQRISHKVQVPIIASGGAGVVQDFIDLYQQTTVTGALAASIFHFQELTIEQVKQGLQKEGVPVRL